MGSLLLQKTYCAVSQNGKITSKKQLLSKNGLAIGNKDIRIKPTDQILHILEQLTLLNYHFVLQSSEGQSIKVVDQFGFSKCVLFLKSRSFQIFNLKFSFDQTVSQLCKLCLTNVNIRLNKKSKYTYIDFDNTHSKESIVKFIKELPQSSACKCGHTTNYVKTRKVIKLSGKECNLAA